MAFASDRRRFVFVFDSRGKHLETILKSKNVNKQLVDMLFFDGADIEDLYREAVNYCRGRPFDIMFIVGGICNVTTKNRKTKVISFDWQDPKVLLNHLMSEISKGENYFHRELPASKVVFCHLVGANLEKVLGRHADYEQYVLNEAIYELNENIFRINIKKQLYAPDMATPVHRKIQNINSSFYHHLAEDGLHLSQDLREKWVKKMLTTAEKFQ